MQYSKVAVFETPGKPFELVNTAIPPLQEQEILIRNEYTTLCRSDIYTYTGQRKEKSPTILGHEIVGRIESFGPGAPLADFRGTPLAVGDRVTWAIFASNPASTFSKLGMPQKAEDLFKYGHEQITPSSNLHGGLSEYTILRKNTPIIKLTENIPLPVVTIINCAVATVAGAVRLAGDLNNQNVLVSGVGMLGIIACAMCKARGAAKVIALDTNSERLSTSRFFGVDETILIDPTLSDFKPLLAEKLGAAFPIHRLIELSGAPQAMESTLELLSIGGVAVWIGATYPQRSVQVNGEQMVRRILTVKGLHNYNEQDLAAAVDFVEQWHTVYPFADLVHGGFALEQVEQAFQYALDKNPFRVGIDIFEKV
jgi:putative phosphonate catabolism associated alcohol dehydrogenase